MESRKTDIQARDQQSGRGFIADDAAMPAELGDEDLAQVSGGCRKAGGELAESDVTFYKSIIAI